MNKKMLSCAALAVLAAVSFVSAQDKTPDYSGTWKLDVTKSELGERVRLEAMDMTVEQTADLLSVEREPKLASGNGGGMGGMGRGLMGAGRLTYSLKGKENKSESALGEVVTSAKSGKDGLKLTQNRNLETQMGSFSLKTVETWELSADGKTLTINSSTETPRGNRTQKMVFSKQ